ncbi:hypothetical protein SDJN03_22553, partial [Cucurbita argyrosperma subsp. sororia]
MIFYFLFYIFTEILLFLSYNYQNALPLDEPGSIGPAGVREARTEIRNLKRRRFERTLYVEAAWRLAGMLVGEKYTAEDARVWISAAVANHRSCSDGVEEVGAAANGNNLTVMLTEALHL